MIDWIKRKFAPAPVAKRAYDGAAGGRLTADWITGPMSADAAMNGRLNTLRDRSRDLERNNPWVRGFLRILENNVIGETGIGLQMRVADPNGRQDEVANQLIENAWWRWGRVRNCSLNGRYSWVDIQRLVIRSIARDGEVILRKVRTKDGLKLQVIEADYLDLDFTTLLTTGNEVRYGVELDKNTQQVVAYHLLGWHPGDSLPIANRGRDRQRIPAAEIHHLFISDRPGQTRAAPWLVASMKTLRMLDGYSEAELVAARTAASKMGFFTSDTPEGYAGEKDEQGNLTMDASPGVLEQLPMGVKFESWDPSHPNNAFGDFIKSHLRGAATSLGVSYNTFASDLEGVNYSSIRAGLLEEREVWKHYQRFLIEHLCEPLFSEWLQWEMIRPEGIALPVTKLAKFDVPDFRGRRWAWVDPKKDVEAAVTRINAGLSSQRREIAEGGGDLMEIFADQAADHSVAKEMGLNFPELGASPSKGAAAGGSASNDSTNTADQESQNDAAAAGVLQSTALNGAQVQALSDLANQVTAGALPVSTAKAIASAAFPLIDAKLINMIFDGLEGFIKSEKPAKPAND